MASLERCVWCKADLYPHCRNGSRCTWLMCRRDKGGCGVTIDVPSLRANRDGEPVPWPHTLPDAGCD